MVDTIKCACATCGAKYRLPPEAAGRSAKCKQCGNKFEVPKLQRSLEDSILDWLAAPAEEEEHEVVDRPRVVSMPADKSDDSGIVSGSHGIIRMKTGKSKG